MTIYFILYFLLCLRYIAILIKKMTDINSNATVLRSPVMTCMLVIDYLTSAGTTSKTTTYKTAKVLLGRNQFK